MRFKSFLPAIMLLPTLMACSGMVKPESLRFYDLDSGRTLGQQAAMQLLQAARIVLVGEQHTRALDHRAQLEIIRALHQSGRRLAIGLEMFRQENQADLDRWTAGDLNEKDFEAAYLANWGFDWSLYRPIFTYARRQQIPMVGLNIPWHTTSQVARHGFESLSDEQKGLVESLSCDIAPEYRAHIRQVYQMHAHGQITFEHFCQAQLLWDTAMAEQAVSYLNRNPDTLLIILAGSVHAQKMGIPTQLHRLVPWSVVVVLPETPGIFDPERTTAAQADLLLLEP